MAPGGFVLDVLTQSRHDVLDAFKSRLQKRVDLPLNYLKYEAAHNTLLGRQQVDWAVAGENPWPQRSRARLSKGVHLHSSFVDAHFAVGYI